VLLTKVWDFKEMGCVWLENAIRPGWREYPSTSSWKIRATPAFDTGLIPLNSCSAGCPCASPWRHVCVCGLYIHTSNNVRPWCASAGWDPWWGNAEGPSAGVGKRWLEQGY